MRLRWHYGFFLTSQVNFAQWRYSNQWSNREVLLLLVENYTQYPAHTGVKIGLRQFLKASEEAVSICTPWTSYVLFKWVEAQGMSILSITMSIWSVTMSIRSVTYVQPVYFIKLPLSKQSSPYAHITDCEHAIIDATAVDIGLLQIDFSHAKEKLQASSSWTGTAPNFRQEICQSNYRNDPVKYDLNIQSSLRTILIKTPSCFIGSWAKVLKSNPTTAGLEPAILSSGNWCLIH